MARGTQFLPLVTRLRDELGRSNSPAVGVDDLPSLKSALNHVYLTLYQDHDWPHLKRTFPKLTVNPGERFKDFPTGLNSERVLRVVVWFNNEAHDIERGIDFEDYTTYDAEADERSDPIQSWDVKWTGTTDQIEFWPLPATAQDAQFIGIQSVTRLVNDSDLCLLDDDLVVLFAAARLLKRQKSQDADTVLGLAQNHLKMLKANSKGGLRRYRVGLGGPQATRLPTKATVRVSG